MVRFVGKIENDVRLKELLVCLESKLAVPVSDLGAISQ